MTTLYIDKVDAEFAAGSSLRIERTCNDNSGKQSEERAGSKHHQWPPLLGDETVARVAPVEMPPSTSSVWPVM